MFDSLHRLWNGFFPCKNAVVTFDECIVTLHDIDGSQHQIAWDDLTSVEIVTNDAGPFVEDVFWVLHGSSRDLTVLQLAHGCQQLSERLQTLPGFDNDAAISAMCCTSNANFPVWQRERS